MEDLTRLAASGLANCCAQGALKADTHAWGWTEATVAVEEQCGCSEGNTHTR